MDRCIRCDREIGRLELPVGVQIWHDPDTGCRQFRGELCSECVAKRSAALDELGKLDGDML